MKYIIRTQNGDYLFEDDRPEYTTTPAIIGVGIDPATDEIAVMTTSELPQEKVDKMNEELLKKMSKKEMRQELKAAQRITMTMLSEIGDYQKELEEWAELGKSQNEFIEELSTKLNNARTKISVLEDKIDQQCYHIKALVATKNELGSICAQRAETIAGLEKDKADIENVYGRKLAYLEKKAFELKHENLKLKKKNAELEQEKFDLECEIQELNNLE